jgi:hypothetical protein
MSVLGLIGRHRPHPSIGGGANGANVCSLIRSRAFGSAAQTSAVSLTSNNFDESIRRGHFFMSPDTLFDDGAAGFVVSEDSVIDVDPVTSVASRGPGLQPPGSRRPLDARCWGNRQREMATPSPMAKTARADMLAGSSDGWGGRAVSPDFQMACSAASLNLKGSHLMDGCLRRAKER